MSKEQQSSSRFSREDIEVINMVSTAMWEATGEDILSRLTPKQAFMLGFLNSREFTLEQLGIFDDEELTTIA